MVKIKQKSAALALRKAGYSYSDIAQKVGVSKSTLSLWFRGVAYVPNETTIMRIKKARENSNDFRRKNKQESIKRAERFAKDDIGEISRRDIFMLGLGLYVGEGSKTHGIVRIVNSDPAIIRFAVRWFEEWCGLAKDNLTLRMHLYPDNDEGVCREFWSGVTGIDGGRFQKTSIDRRIDKKRVNRSKLPYGTAHLGVRSNGNRDFGVFLARRIQGWMALVLSS